LSGLYLAPVIEAQDSHFQGNASATGGLPYGKVSFVDIDREKLSLWATAIASLLYGASLE
jgi:hypothetical protein